MDVWSDCAAWSRRLLAAAELLSGYRHLRHRRYEDWWVHPDSADAVVRTLLALGIHSLVLDAMAQGRSYTPELIGRLRPADIGNAVTKRPDHELLAGLPALDEADRLRVDVVRILTYDPASALTAVRLRALAHGALHGLGKSVSAEDPVCEDVAGMPR
ncbi:hypothetical protein OG223_22210 [Streptomyces sp. NBC_01478]|uniref:hypothetical protein n=1 Tax=Streptomyces sp. NBC_01478 TaxID=2903882 RepID=UPI002E34A3D5|nr:hypothetical protein [Streptomyces sp. NBC_01478]